MHSENPYELGQQKVIPAVLIYVFCKNEVLMVHRNNPNRSLTDIHFGKWNGLGGKLEKGEYSAQAAQRELQEESGLFLEISEFKNIGSLYFPNFKPHKNEDWWVSLFYVELEEKPKISFQDFQGEGRLEWIPKNKLLSLPLWEGDQHFLPLVLKKQPFEGSFWYDKNKKLTRFILNPYFF